MVGSAETGTVENCAGAVGNIFQSGIVQCPEQGKRLVNPFKPDIEGDSSAGHRRGGLTGNVLVRDSGIHRPGITAA